MPQACAIRPGLPALDRTEGLRAPGGLDYAIGCCNSMSCGHSCRANKVQFVVHGQQYWQFKRRGKQAPATHAIVPPKGLLPKRNPWIERGNLTLKW